MTGVLSAEWLKLRSVRSTHYLFGVAVLLIGGAALLSLARVTAWENLSAQTRAENSGGGTTEETILQFVQLLGGIVGVLTFTSEYATGLIRSTFAVVPRRPIVLVAKAAVVAAGTAVMASAVMFMSYAFSEAVVGDRMPAYEPGFGEQLPHLAALAGSVVVVALLGLGLGALLRSATGAIAILVVLLFIGQMVVMFLPEPFSHWIYSALPVSLPDQLAGVPPRIVDGPAGDPVPHTVLSVPGAWAMAAGYVVASLGAAYLAITRRDVR
ncbi:ABC transporter permease [Phytomonospora endophytica]|uniref:ABC transporter permease n=1 Tax=Phytomonospora endophytica TaxID=714109 RepID=A0A841FQK5_9ACTN|nr:ABC transporter permease [Phytomonospora endophytica]MBB6037113.1 hypothetical protein [Phytomonospora endophytica]GIG71152.1 ABC transporter permease [Phytomonospora endophytica]